MNTNLEFFFFLLSAVLNDRFCVKFVFLVPYKILLAVRRGYNERVLQQVVI